MEQLPSRYNMQFTYLLRWRFDYFDSKPSKFGEWSRHGASPATQAWSQSRDSLRRVAIESKHLLTREVKVQCYLDGHRYRNLQWLAMAACPMIPIGEVKLQETNVGLILSSDEDDFIIFSDGRILAKKRTEQQNKSDDKDMHYAKVLTGIKEDLK